MKHCTDHHSKGGQETADTSEENWMTGGPRLEANLTFCVCMCVCWGGGRSIRILVYVCIYHLIWLEFYLNTKFLYYLF